MDDRKSAQTEWWQNRSSSLFPFHLRWNLPPFPSFIWLLLALTTSPSLILLGLGFILDSKLSMKKHVKICQIAYFELKCISLIHRFLTEDAAKTLVTSYILSQLDYCNCLLIGTPNSVIQRLQKILNFAARLVLLATNTQHLSWKNCTGFPFQNVLNIKSLVCVSVL